MEADTIASTLRTAGWVLFVLGLIAGLIFLLAAFGAVTQTSDLSLLAELTRAAAVTYFLLGVLSFALSLFLLAFAQAIAYLVLRLDDGIVLMEGEVRARRQRERRQMQIEDRSGEHSSVKRVPR